MRVYCCGSVLCLCVVLVLISYISISNIQYVLRVLCMCDACQCAKMNNFQGRGGAPLSKHGATLFWGSKFGRILSRNIHVILAVMGQFDTVIAPQA